MALVQAGSSTSWSPSAPSPKESATPPSQPLLFRAEAPSQSPESPEIPFSFPTYAVANFRVSMGLIL